MWFGGQHDERDGEWKMKTAYLIDVMRVLNCNKIHMCINRCDRIIIWWLSMCILLFFLTDKLSCYVVLQLHNIRYGDVDGWAKKSIANVLSYFSIMNPHTKFVQQWNKFFVISCLIAIFIDPLFFFLLSVKKVQMSFFPSG
jgi:hypothetical protein